MDKALFDRIIQALSPDMSDERTRKPRIEAALYGAPVLAKIDWTGPQDVFTYHLVQTLDRFGDLESGMPALAALLSAWKAHVGADRQQILDDLIRQLAPPTVIPSPPPSGEQHAFISYSRKDTPFVERLEAALHARGITTWRDAYSIPGGVDWYKSIMNGLANAYALLCIVTPNAEESDWVTREQLRAEEDKIPLLAVHPAKYRNPLHLQLVQPILMDDASFTAGLEQVIAALDRCKMKTRSAPPVTVSPAFTRPDDDAAIAEYLKWVLSDAKADLRDALYVDLAASPERAPQMRAKSALATGLDDDYFVFSSIGLEHLAHEDFAKPGEEVPDARQAIRDLRRAVLLGDPGAGKTTTLLKIAVDLARAAQTDKAARLPVFVPLREFDGSTSFEAFVRGKTHNLQAAFDRLRDRFVLLCDALNEMPRKGTTDGRDLVAEVRDTLSGRADWVVSCRVRDYTDDLSGIDGIGKIRLKPLDPPRIQEFITRKFAELPERGAALWSALGGSDLLADNPTVFISYAHPDLAHAEKVEAALRAAGFTVFIDKTALRGGEWDAMIENALREHDRMVLLLSRHSMPHRKEVHREWFYFDQHRKPIHPILIADCDLHSRMLAYQYRDGRADLDAALAQIAADLRQPFQLVTDAAPRDPLQDYFQKRIEDLTQPRHALDRRFVRLTLLIDQGDKADGMRWINPQPNRRFDDLRAVMDELKAHTAMVVLGAPGSGKSTLLRRLQLDECAAHLSDGGRVIPFFAPLNAYRGDKTPLEWLSTRWAESAPGLPPLSDLLNAGRMLLLLDALNEMPGNDARELVGRWRDFLKAMPPGNRAVITCRTLDYSAPLSAPPDFGVPQIELQPMTPEQIHEFLTAYLPDRAETVWAALKDTPQMALFSAPFFLKLLVDQVDRAGTIPEGRAALFAGFVRGGIEREIGRDHALFAPGELLTEKDHQQITMNRWAAPHALPARGVLIPKLSDLAYKMQTSGTRREGGQVLVDYDTACRLIEHPRHEDILKAGEALHVVDEDIARDEVRYFHQLLQEFFAARVIAAAPNPALVQVEWQADRVSPSLEETLKTLADNDPLPPLTQTGWEETMLTAAAMSADPDAFVRGLMAVNLPLAGRAAAASDVRVSDAVKREVQNALIARTQDMCADLRARIAAGEALGVLGDPRFERKTGKYGDYLLPPLVSIDGGVFLIGSNESENDLEKPVHEIELESYQIGQFPVTNAEYALFINAGGYEHRQWWEFDGILKWENNRLTCNGQIEIWRAYRKAFSQYSRDDLEQLSPLFSQRLDILVQSYELDDTEFDHFLLEQLSENRALTKPAFWGDDRFANPNQPVVGVTWYEAKAYCRWLSNESGYKIDLPTEMEWESAVRASRHAEPPNGNTRKLRILRPSPIGVFPPNRRGIFDFSGNVWGWTNTVFGKYGPSKEVEISDTHQMPIRMIRGGSWMHYNDAAEATFRGSNYQYGRYDDVGFRVCVHN